MGHRKESETSARRIASRKREGDAMRLRSAGLTYREIADKLGVTVGTAHKAVHRVLDGIKATTETEACKLADLEEARLDKMLTNVWVKAVNGEGWAVDRVLRIMERRAKLRGLDAPAKRETDVPRAIPDVIEVVFKNKGEGDGGSSVGDGGNAD